MAIKKQDGNTSKQTLDMLNQIVPKSVIDKIVEERPEMMGFIYKENGPHRQAITFYQLHMANVECKALIDNDPKFAKILADMTAKAIDYTETRRDAGLEQQQEQFEKLMSVISEVKITIINAGAESEVKKDATKDI